MEYVRTVDEAAVAAAGNQRFNQWLLDHTSGGRHCSINYIKTPAGGGSPAGMHTHVVDQIFYILAGTMSLEIEGKPYEAGPGSLVVFPAGGADRQLEGGAGPAPPHP